MLLRLQGSRASQVELRRPELNVLRRHLTADQWLQIANCQQRMHHALQRYLVRTGREGPAAQCQLD